MASLFELSKRRRQAKDWADKFREGASPEELEYFDRFYQEPTASPIMQRGALEGELDMVDAIQRQLMARGMNALQAKDAAERAEAERKASLGTRAQDIATTRGPGGIGGTGEGSYEDYSRSQIPEPRINEFPEPPPEPEDWGKQQLSLEDWAMQRAIEQGMAGDISAESKARYDEQTVEGRIRQQIAASEELLDAKVADANLSTLVKQELANIVRIMDDPQSTEADKQNALAKSDNIHRILSGPKSTGTTMPGWGTEQFLDEGQQEQLRQEVQPSQPPTREGLIAVPTTEKVEGDYPR